MAVYKHRGKWMYDFQKNQVRHREGGFETKTDAQLAEAQAKKNLRMINTDFIKLCESRLAELEIRRSSQYFRENKELIEKLIVLWAGKKRILREDVEAYLNQTARRSVSVANKELRFIKALFNHGIEREWIIYNPAGRVKPYPMQKQRKYIPPKEDVDKVLSKATGLDKAYLVLVKNTLARIGEINQLKWSDVFDNYIILKTRKAKNSDLKERRIPIGDETRNALQGIPKLGEYVFINPRTHTRYIYRKGMMKGLCKEAKVKFFNFHSIRHYGASRLIAEGARLTDVQYLLGHEKATTTAVYLQSIGINLETTITILEG